MQWIIKIQNQPQKRNFNQLIPGNKLSYIPYQTHALFLNQISIENVEITSI